MNERIKPEDFSKIVAPKGYERVPLLLSGRGTTQPRAVGWYHRDRDDDFILIPLDEFGFLENDSVAEVLKKL